MATQDDIDNYVLGTNLIYPLVGREQLESMVILHFDIPDKITHDMVGNSLIKAIGVYSREEKILAYKLRDVRKTIDRLREWTPEAEEGK